MKRPKEAHPTPFEVAIEKGDYELPSEVVPPGGPSKEFLKTLLAWGTFFNRLGGRLDIVYWVGILTSHGGNIKETAAVLGITPRGLYARIARLEEHYYKVTHPRLPYGGQAPLPKQK